MSAPTSRRPGKPRDAKTSAPMIAPIPSATRRGSPDRHSALDFTPLHGETTMTAALETPTASKYPDVRNYIAGRFIDGDGSRMLDVTNPADGSVLSRVPLSGSAEIDRAVAA